MNDYTSLVSILTSLLLFLFVAAFYFGKLTSINEIEDKDRDTHTIEGLYFIFRHIIASLILITVAEISMQDTVSNRNVTLALSTPLFIQFLLGLIILTVLLKTGSVSRYFLSLNTKTGMLLAKFTYAIFKKPYLRHIVITVDIIILYIFLRAYASKHVILLGLDLPADYGMGTYVLSSIVITFISFTAARMIDKAADSNLDVVVQLDDKTTVSGQLWKWGKFVEVRDSDKILYINESSIRMIERKNEHNIK